MGVSLHQIIHYYLYHSSTIVQPYVIEHNTNVLMNCLQKYQGTGFNLSVVSETQNLLF